MAPRRSPATYRRTASCSSRSVSAKAGSPRHGFCAVGFSHPRQEFGNERNRFAVGTAKCVSCRAHNYYSWTTAIRRVGQAFPCPIQVHVIQPLTLRKPEPMHVRHAAILPPDTTSTHDTKSVSWLPLCFTDLMASEMLAGCSGAQMACQ
jgi:hypothetical protein